MKLGLGVLTLINVALTCFGVSMAMMSPMLFDAGGEQDQLLWAVFWGIFVFPAVAFVCVFVPWYFCGLGGRVLLCSPPPFQLRGS